MPNIVPLDMPAAYWRDKAQRAQRGGRTQEAVRLYRAALRKHDDNGIRRELAQAYADMRSMSASDRLYLENLARDVSDTDSLYGLARNRALAGDAAGMADLLDLYLRLSPCGEQADRARDILWQQPRPEKQKKRMRRAMTLCEHAIAHRNDMKTALELAKKSWKRGKTAQTAQLLSSLYQCMERGKQALKYAVEACGLAPEDMNAHLLLATALKQQGMRQAGRAALRQAMKLCREIEEAPAFCRFAIDMDEAEQAVALLEGFLKKYPASTDLLLLLALSLRAEEKEEERVQSLLHTAAALDPDDPVPRMMLEFTFSAGNDPMQAQMEHVIGLMQQVNDLEARPKDNRQLHEETVRLMRMPMPGMTELAFHVFIKMKDAVGLRMVLLEGGLQPILYGAALNELHSLGEPLPCFARIKGHLCLLPQQERAPYDADLHALIHRLLHDAAVREQVSLDAITRLIPAIWRRLPESARRHCAQSRDDVWLSAFAAYLLLCCRGAQTAEGRLAASRTPLRAGRAYMQIIRRSKRPYEVH